MLSARMCRCGAELTGPLSGMPFWALRAAGMAIVRGLRGSALYLFQSPVHGVDGLVWMWVW